MTIASRTLYDGTQPFDRCVQNLTYYNGVYGPRAITLFRGTEYVAALAPASWSRVDRALLTVIRDRIASGQATLELETPFGTFAPDEVPEWAEIYVRQREVFRRLPPLPLPVAESRRAQVREWARANTTSRQMVRFIIHGKPPGPAAVLDGKRRSAGEIWWAFVLMTVAASLDDEWIEDEDVWPAIERNIGVTAEEFCGPTGGVSLQNWVEPAAYMAALSRIYKAGASLVDAPDEVDLHPVAPLARLHAGSDAAKLVIYGAEE